MQPFDSMLVVVAVLSSVAVVAIGFGITLDRSWQRRFFALPRLLQKLYVLCFMAPVLALPLVPQQRLDLHAGWALGTGAAVTLLALLCWGAALWQMRGIPSVRRPDGLVDSGIYGWVRNPIYTGNFLILPGLGLMTQSLAALVYAPLWLLLLGILCVLEERGLREQYGQAYQEYCRAVPHRLVRGLF